MADGLLILLVLLGTFVVFALAFVAAVMVALRMAQRRNRVSPSTPSDAPTTWLASPMAGARLHRRLRTAVAVAQRSAAAVPSVTHLTDLAADLEREAVVLDAHVVMASRMSGPQGRARMRALVAQVRHVEQLASQISLLAAQAQAPLVAGGHTSALEDLARKLEMLEEARHEVHEVERQAGVQRVSPYGDPTRVRPEPGTEPPADAPTTTVGRIADQVRKQTLPGT